MEHPAIAGMLRIRNEELWIAEVLLSLLPVCNRGVLVLDDHSSDRTLTICEAIADSSPGLHVLSSPYAEIDEARDKDYLLASAMNLCRPEWVVCIDGDEVLAADALTEIERAIREDCAHSFAFQVMYLWDSLDRIRVDGLYGNFWRPSLFNASRSIKRFRRTAFGGNFHCSNVPVDMLESYSRCGVQLKHYGYVDREQRIRKWHWYNSIDPGNTVEDCYRHMVQGDVPEVPRDAKLMHAGPLRLEAWQ